MNLLAEYLEFAAPAGDWKAMGAGAGIGGLASQEPNKTGPTESWLQTAFQTGCDAKVSSGDP